MSTRLFLAALFFMFLWLQLEMDVIDSIYTNARYLPTYIFMNFLSSKKEKENRHEEIIT